MSKEQARQAVLSEYDSWAKQHPNQASMMGGFLFFRYLQEDRAGLGLVTRPCLYRKRATFQCPHLSRRSKVMSQSLLQSQLLLQVIIVVAFGARFASAAAT